MTETAANSAPRRIQAILMDQFGTLTDQHGSMTRLLTAEASVAAAVGCGAGSGAGVLATSLAARGHGAGATDPPFEMSRTGRDRLERVCGTVEGWIPQENVTGASGPGDIDELHLELLDELLETEEYKVIAEAWSAEKRKEICQFWHRLDAWPDTKPALDAIRKLDPPVLLATLSNGTLRLLIDVARHNELSIDAHFSGNLLQSYKPNPVMYCRASELLGFDAAAREAGKVAMFASHVEDLIAAKQQGLYTIYIRRPTEDTGRRDGVKTFAEGGQVDVIIDDMSELVKLLRIGSGRRGKEIRVRKKERNPDLPPKQKKDALDALENQGVEPCTSRTS
ncbi:hypothetical protein C6P46_000611 [Rhodotorula mucilaginosa]|uniref:Haloacid dehalogenase n=1 Tax=Rhodotorula mucilaginosa TaxID=5537 RepID=A0A9P6W576_RHOMI|nr:hypothetical protein C6P46_000611 [Rhodotorula mucilaginosa]